MEVKSRGCAVAAKVTHQWYGELQSRKASLLVFGYAFKPGQASLLARFVDTYPFSMEGAPKAKILANVRCLVDAASAALRLLRGALRRAWSKQRKAKGSFWPADAEEAFWTETEPVFWEAVVALQNDEGFGSVFAAHIVRTARNLFVRNTEHAIADPRHQELIATQERNLRTSLRNDPDIRAITPKEEPRGNTAA